MNCRYCGGVYAVSERTCGGCGSPKTVVETFLDVPAAPDHWSHSMVKTVQQVALVTGVLSVVTFLMSLIGLGEFGAFFLIFWIIPLAPIGLAMGAWQSSVGNFNDRIRNFIVAGLLWVGIFIAALILIALVTGTS